MATSSATTDYPVSPVTESERVPDSNHHRTAPNGDSECANYQASGLPKPRILANPECQDHHSYTLLDLGGVAWPGTDARAQSRSPLIARILACLPWIARSGFSPGTRGMMGAASAGGAGAASGVRPGQPSVAGLINQHVDAIRVRPCDGLRQRHHRPVDRLAAAPPRTPASSWFP